MKNLVTELLLKLAQKEEESQDLAVQVETLRNMAWNDRQIFIRQIEGALADVNRMPAFLTNIHNACEIVPKAF